MRLDICRALLVSMMIASNASAFDVNGFRTGQTLDEVAAVVKSRGMTLGFIQEGGYRTVGFHADGTRDYSGTGNNFWFCADRLVNYSYEIPAGELASDVADMVLLFGSVAKVSTTTYEWGGADGELLRSVKLTWERGDEIGGITITPPTKNPDGSTRFEQSISGLYATRNNCWNAD